MLIVFSDVAHEGKCDGKINNKKNFRNQNNQKRI